MLITWIYVLIGLVITGITYFEVTGPIMQVLDKTLEFGAPEWFINSIISCYHTAFIILPVGIILYGIIQSLKTEPDSYKN